MAKRPTRRAKQPRRSGSTQRARRRAAAGPSPSTLAHQVVEGYSGIASERDPMQLELAASAIAAYALLDFWQSSDDDAPHPAEPILALLQQVRDTTLADDAVVLAMSLRAIAFSDERAVAIADEAIRKLRFLGARPGTAAQFAGTATPTQAWTHSDIWGEQLTLSIGYRYADAPDAPEHTLSVLIDANLGSIKDAFLAHPIEQLVEIMRGELAADPAGATVLRLEQVELSRAAALLTLGIEWTEEALADGIYSDEAFDLLPLVDARCDALLKQTVQIDGEAVFDVDPRFYLRASELDGLDALDVIERFVASAEYTAEVAAGANAASAAAIALFATTIVEGGAARFGPTMPEWFALGELPHMIVEDEQREQLRVGVIPTLRAWTRFTHRLLDLPQAAVDEVLANVEVIAPHLEAFMHEFNTPPMG